MRIAAVSFVGQQLFDRFVDELISTESAGKFHDQGDAEWIVIRGQLRGHNDTPCGRPNPVRPIGRPRVGHPQGIFGGFSYYSLVI
jgi:hypothetical protein